MAVQLSPVFGVAGQLFDNNGNPLAGGKIFTYAAGTTTPAATYTNASGSIAHSNPIVLDGAGRVPSGEIWLTDGIAYKFVVEDSTSALIGTYDNLSGINSNFVAYTSQQEIQTATAGQTVFNLTTIQYQPGTNNLSVFVDGVNQYGPGAQYAFVETDSDTVTFVSGLHVGASVKFTTAQLNNSGSTDAENVSYTAPYTNAVTTNVEVVLSRTVNAADFGMDEAASPSTNANAIMDAIAALDAGIGKTGGVVYLPKGKFDVASDVVSLVGVTNVTLQGDGNANAYEGSDAGTQLTFTPGTVCIDVDDSAGVGSASAYNTIKNLYISGNDLVAYGLRVRGRTNITNMFVMECTIGYEVVDYGNQTLFETSTAFANDIGFQITGYSTSKVTVNNCNFRQNRIGVNLLAGYHVWFQGCVIESNDEEGLIIYKADAAPIYAPRNITFLNNFFENNGAVVSTKYAITIDAQTPTYSARRVIFNGNYFAEDKLVNINDVSICQWSNNIYGSACASTTGPNATEVVFYDIDPASLGITFAASQRSGYNILKESGQGGFTTDLAFYTQGGRTQTLWFTNTSALVAGVETVLQPLSVGVFTPALLTYPIYGQGCVIGIVAQAQTAITTGSLKFKPYATLGWNGIRYTYGLELDVLASSSRGTVTADVEDYPIPHAGNYNYNNLGLAVTPSAAPVYVGPDDLMVGLVIAY
jgi:hypothetical protein